MSKDWKKKLYDKEFAKQRRIAKKEMLQQEIKDIKARAKKRAKVSVIPKHKRVWGGTKKSYKVMGKGWKAWKDSPTRKKLNKGIRKANEEFFK